MRKETSPEVLSILGDDAQRHEELLDLIEGEFDKATPILSFGKQYSRYEELTIQDTISNNIMYLGELIKLREKYGLKV